MLSALRFREPNLDGLRSLEEREWEHVLSFSDPAQLTLLLGSQCSASLPEAVRRRIDQNVSDNTERLERVKRDAFEIAASLREADAAYVTLKGFTQWPRYVADPRLRVQYDLDLFSPPETLMRTRDVLLSLGYDPVEGLESFPVDHLPTMIRRTGWQWRGDYFDPEIPVAVDLHFRFWDEETERFPAPGAEEFWERRTGQVVDGRIIPVLHPADALGYSSLHLLRHLLRGSLRLYHVYEIAYFLDRQSGDEVFWNSWKGLHRPELRRMEAVVFRLAQEWFGCQLPGTAEEEIQLLGPSIGSWFERYSASPVEGLVRPNKDELWLHLCLLDGWGNKRRVLRRRLLPARLPGRGPHGGVPETQVTARMRRQAGLRYWAHAATRASHHARALAPALWHGAGFWWRLWSPGKAYWKFLLAASLYNFGAFIFLLLYNLYLLDLGFREDFLGVVASAMTAGSIVGAMPAGWLAHRLGLRRTLALCFGGSGVISALRCLVSGHLPLAATAFLGGVFTSGYAVAVPPSVSGLTNEQKRPLGFSVFFATGISMGILGGVIGGRLPGWLREAAAVEEAAAAKQAALLIGCALAAVAAWPAFRLELPQAAPRDRKTYPWNAFLARFLPVLALWSFAIGAFNPFFTAYFARQVQASEARIGVVFSGSQLLQVGAILLAPVVLRKFGLIGGIAGMQIAASLALAGLAGGPPVLAAGALYAAYMAFQSMTEPGAYSLLMNQVGPAERSGASAINFAVIFVSQATAAAASGAAITQFGYPAVIASAAGIAAGAALLFYSLLRKFAR